MNKNIRAKVKCTSKIDGDTYEQLVFTAVYSEDKLSENYAFSVATPALHINMSITNPTAMGIFEIDKEYYLDFSPAN